MPIYQYECSEHGSFEGFNRMTSCNNPVDCPECGKESSRVYTIPRVRQIAKSKERAIDTNMKSRHQPHVCGSGCSHGHSHSHPKKKKKEGLQAYGGPRPWVIEHA